MDKFVGGGARFAIAAKYPTFACQTRGPEDAGERRRRALITFMEQHRLTPSDLARLAGLPTPNALYNHLHGRSTQLSVETLEAIATAVPGTSIGLLTGFEQPQPVTVPDAVEVRWVAQAGVWQAAGARALRPQRPHILARPELIQGGGFGVELRAPGFEARFATGTVLICTPPRGSSAFGDGRIIVIQRQRDQEWEITAREVRLDGETCVLWPDTHVVSHQRPLAVPLWGLASPVGWNDQGTITRALGVAVEGAVNLQ